jgi:hypothetical protein
MIMLGRRFLTGVQVEKCKYMTRPASQHHNNAVLFAGTPAPEFSLDLNHDIL